jgi:hypothetical protein
MPREMSGENSDSEYPLHSEELEIGIRNGFYIKHLPSKIMTRIISYEDIEKIYKNQLKARDVLIQELIAELKAKGIAPQPPKVAVKKLGKPRWGEADKQR